MKRLVFESGVMMAIVAIIYAILSCLHRNHWYLIPGLALSKISGTGMLILLNNRIVILGGRNTSHAEFDIPAYRQSVIAKAEVNSGISRDIIFVSEQPMSATTSMSSESVL